MATRQTVLTILSCALLVGTQWACNIVSSEPRQPDQYALRLISELQSSESKFHHQYGRYGPLEEMAKGEVEPLRSNLGRAATGSYHGYVFHLQADADHYRITAGPEQWGVSGRRSFYCDESRTVRESWAQEIDANRDSKVLK
jgi:hypothetical protein